MITKDQKNYQLNILKEKLNKVKIAMMTTHTDDGQLSSRPMECRAMDAEGRLWFFSKLETGKVHEIDNDPRVNLAFGSPGSQTYISISGDAQLVSDPERKKAFFRSSDKAFWPDGPDNEELGLICVAPELVEYWDTLDMRLVQWFKMAKAIFKGEKYVAGEYSRFEPEVEMV